MRRFGSALLVLSLAVACTPGGVILPRQPGSAAAESYAASQQLAQEDPESAVRELKLFLRTWPRDPKADDAALLLARIELHSGNMVHAKEWLRWILRTHSRGDRVHAARLRLAQLELQEKHEESAYRLAVKVNLEELTETERREAHRFFANLARARGDHVARLRWLSWVRADTVDTDRLAFVDVEIDEVIQDMDVSELRRVAQQLEQRAPAARVRLRLTQLLLEKRDAEGARKQIAELSVLPMTPAEARRLRDLEGSMRGTGEAVTPLLSDPGRASALLPVPPPTLGAEGTLGVVLPLSGSFQAFGEECLQGILLAARILGEGAGTTAEHSVRLRVRDSRGTPEGAAASVRELAGDPQVLAIVGPLLGDESEAAAVAASEAGIPLVTLAGREEVARGRAGVFRLGLTPRGEMQALVAFAYQRLDVRRFAVLYPRDAFGETLKSFFEDAVKRQGGELAGVAAYAPGVTDFAEPIRSLVGYPSLSERGKTLLRQREDLLDRAARAAPREAAELRRQAKALTTPDGGPLPPIVNFEALFIPDSYGQVVLIAPQLAFHGVEGVHLLGSSGWNHRDLVRIGGKHVEGAVFTEAFFVDEERPYVIEFARRFETAFERPPGAPAAQAFDAANLLLLQLAHGRRSRIELAKGFSEIRGYPGVSGMTTMLADGNAEKDPYVLGVRSGAIVNID